MRVASANSIFLAWCGERNIQSPKLDLQARPDGYRYVTTTESLTSDDYTEIIRVPIQACITGDTLEETADKLLFEKKQAQKSQWAPYLDVLPNQDDFGSMPMFWNEKRLSDVKDGGQLQRVMNSMKSDVDPWAMACVHSRCNFLADKTYALTPLLDMINHNPVATTRAKIKSNKFDEDDSYLSLLTKQVVAEGDELFISYGELTNADTLCQYGFVDQENPANKEELLIPIINKPPTSVIIYSDGSIDTGCKAALRLEMANAEELEEIENDFLAALKPISNRNELDVASFLATYILEALEESQNGVNNAKADDLVSNYLMGRVSVLQKALDLIEKQFPGIEY